MSKQRKRGKTLNPASPSTPTHASKHRADDNIYATPKSHYIQDYDSDSSPYCLSFSQRAIEVEVTWGERSRSIPYKSKKRAFEVLETESPPTKTYVDVEPIENESPKGVYKFNAAFERRRRLATQIEDDIERINNEPASAQNWNCSTITNGNSSSSAAEHVEATKSFVSNSLNVLNDLLNDSEDMDLVLCSQRIEQEVLRSTEPVIKAIASKGFSEIFSDDDDDLLLANLDHPLLLDKPLPQKSSFARHKSIAIQPNSSITNRIEPLNLNSSINTETKSVVLIQPVVQKEPSTPSTTSITTAPLIRHKSMPSPNVTISNTTKKCSAEEIEIKRLNVLAKLKERKERFTKK